MVCPRECGPVNVGTEHRDATINDINRKWSAPDVGMGGLGELLDFVADGFEDVDVFAGPGGGGAVQLVAKASGS